MSYQIMVLVLATGIIGVSATAQNIHLSQFYQAPLLVNPALTGVFNGNQRAILNYRNQWASVSDPFTTYAFSYDMSLLKEKGKNKYLGGGLFFFRDVAGDTKYTTTSANLSLSSIITLDGGHDLSVGLQGGFAQKSIEESSFQWGSQFDGTAHNPAIISGESAVFEPYAFGDFSAGLSWSYARESSTLSSSDDFYASAGIAVYHVNAPKLKYDEQVLYRELLIHAGTYLGIKNTSLSFVPNIILMRQGPSTEVNVGALLRYSIREESKYTGVLKETAVYVGAYARLGDALIPTVVFEITSYSLGISYDIVNSDLQKAAGGKGGIEISFSFINPNPFKYGKGTRYRRRSLM